MHKKDSILTLQRIPHFTKPSVSSEGTRGETTSFGTTFISRKIGIAKADYY